MVAIKKETVKLYRLRHSRDSRQLMSPPNDLHALKSTVNVIIDKAAERVVEEEIFRLYFCLKLLFKLVKLVF